MIRPLVLAAVLSLPVAAGWAEGNRSGYQDASPETRAMQDDDATNPGFLWVQQGEALWSQRPASHSGRDERSCADCHGAARGAMRGVAARYPVFDPRSGRPVTLAQRIDQCRVERQNLTPLPLESDVMLGLTAYVGLQSLGIPMQVAIDGPAKPFFEAGKTLFTTRQGQLNLSCSQCHDGLAGQNLGGSVIPQGHPNGNPEYRLGWQGHGLARTTHPQLHCGRARRTVRAGCAGTGRPGVVSRLASQRSGCGDTRGSALSVFRATYAGIDGPHGSVRSNFHYGDRGCGRLPLHGGRRPAVTMRATVGVLPK